MRFATHLFSLPLLALLQGGWDWPILGPQPLPLAPPEGSGPPSSLDVQLVVDRVQAAYDAMQDFQADFVQEYTNTALGETRTSTGRVYLRKPGMMRWDYAAPNEKYLISDGTTLWVWEPSLDQYYTQPLDESQLPSALRFLMGEGRLSDDFVPSLSGTDSDGRILLDLAPRARTGQIARLTFLVDPADWQVDRVVVTDALGNTNQLTFTGARFDAGLPEDGFHFEPPEGAHRVDPPE